MTNSNQPELNIEAEIRKALIGDFNGLYVPRFTTDFEVQRLVRAAEIAVMNFPRMSALIQQVSDQRVRGARLEEITNAWKNACDLPNADAICRSLAGRRRHLEADYLSHKDETEK